MLRTFLLACAGLATMCSAALSDGMPLLPPGLSHILAQQSSANDLQAAALSAKYPAHALATPVSHFPADERYAPHVNGPFELRYWFDARFHEPQGPVYLLLGGETNGAGRLPFLDHGILPILAEPTNSLSIVLEHRYYGASMVTEDLSTDNLRFLDTAQALADIDFFIRHADIPGVGPIAQLPVIVYGGSYAGAQAAFARHLYPDTVFGSIASSAVTTAIIDFAAYYEPIRQNAPTECVETLIKVTVVIDELLALGDRKVTKRLKAAFGLTNVTDDRDFVNALTVPLSYWQARNWDEAVDSPEFYKFCDSITAQPKHDSAQQPLSSSGPHGLEVELAQMSSLSGGGILRFGSYARYIREHVAALCRTEQQDDCFGTHDAEALKTDDLAQHWRLWQWQVCTEWAYYIGGMSSHLPSLVSRLLDLDYIGHICPLAFPPGNHTSVPKWPEVEHINRMGGYDLTASRLLYIDGSADPWLYATPHSPLAPPLTGPRAPNNTQNMLTIAGGVHHWDENGRTVEPREIARVHAHEVALVRSWLREWDAGVRGA